MNKNDHILLDAFKTERDRAQVFALAFIRAHFTADGNPDDELLALSEQLCDASHGKDATTALWGILAAYGVLTAIVEFLEIETMKKGAK